MFKLLLFIFSRRNPSQKRRNRCLLLIYCYHPISPHHLRLPLIHCLNKPLRSYSIAILPFFPVPHHSSSLSVIDPDELSLRADKRDEHCSSRAERRVNMSQGVILPLQAGSSESSSISSDHSKIACLSITVASHSPFSTSGNIFIACR